MKKDEFVRKSNIIHNNFYGYSKSLYINTSTKLIITCPIHGDFLQLPHNHLRGNGCKTCSARTVVLSYYEFHTQKLTE